MPILYSEKKGYKKSLKNYASLLNLVKLRGKENSVFHYTKEGEIFSILLFIWVSKI